MVKDLYESHKFTLAQNEIIDIHKLAKFIKVLEATNGTGDDLAIAINNGQFQHCFKGFGLQTEGEKAEEKVTKIRVKNLNSSSNTIILGMSDVKIEDDRANIDANVSSNIIGHTGITPYLDATADETKTAMKSSSGDLYSVDIANIDANTAFLQLFDAVIGDVTVGTTTPDYVIPIPAGDGTLYGATLKEFPQPLKFDTAITYAVTTTPTGSDAPTTDLILSAGYI